MMAVGELAFPSSLPLQALLHPPSSHPAGMTGPGAGRERDVGPGSPTPPPSPPTRAPPSALLSLAFPALHLQGLPAIVRNPSLTLLRGAARRQARATLLRELFHADRCVPLALRAWSPGPPPSPPPPSY